MSKNLEKYGFTNFTENDAAKTKFLENVEEGMSVGEISIFPGTVLPAPFPEDVALSPGFYTGQSVSEHESDFPKYHEIIFPIMETISTTISLPETQGVVPPVIDPTIPIQAILIELSLPDLTPKQFTYVIENAVPFINAFNELPDEWKPLAEEIIEIPNLFDSDEEVNEAKDKIKELAEKLSVDIPDFDFPPSFSIPLPPFIDVPAISIPTLSLPNVGIIDFILKLLAAAVDAVKYAVALIKDKIGDFLNKIMEGISALVEWLFGTIFDFLEPLFDKFQSLLKQLGWISTISTIIKYVIGMIIVTIVAFFLGSGLIADGVAKFLNLN